jgi:hypothetical protein
MPILRILVWQAAKRPAIDAESRLRRRSAGAIQVALYLTLLALIASGIVAAAPRPFTPAVQLFGIWTLPRFAGIPSVLLRSAPGIHAALVWTLLGLVGFHVLAAAHGTLIRGDRTIFRMLPWRGQSLDSPSKLIDEGTSQRSSRGELHKVIIMGRAVPITILVIFLMLAGALLSIPFWIGEGVRQLSPTAPMSFQRTIGDTTLKGSLASNPQLAFGLFIDIDPGTAREPASVPDIVFGMTDHPMPPLRPTVRRLGDHRFTAEGAFPMPGRWQLQVILPQGTTEIPFNILTPDSQP